MFGKSKTASRWPLIVAAIAVMIGAAAATLVLTRPLQIDVPPRFRSGLSTITAVTIALLGIGLTLYVRHLVLKMMTSAASKAWTSIRDGAGQQSPWARSDSSSASSPTPEPQPGQAKPPPKLFGTIFGFFLVVWFAIPLWMSILRAFSMHKTPLLSWLPLIAYAIWAARRHGGKI